MPIISLSAPWQPRPTYDLRTVRLSPPKHRPLSTSKPLPDGHPFAPRRTEFGMLPDPFAWESAVARVVRSMPAATPAPIVEMPAETPIANEPVGAPGRRVSTLLG
jgi:hypothetical protein